MNEDPTSAKETPAVQREINALADEVGNLLSVIDALGERLSPVLSPASAEADKEACPSITVCTIVSDISLQKDRVATARNDITLIRERLQV